METSELNYGKKVGRRRSTQRIFGHRELWKIGIIVMLGAASSHVVHADRPILVLADQMQPGQILPGGGFHTENTSVLSRSDLGSRKAYPVTTITHDANGAPVSVGTISGGIEWGVPVPNTDKYGIRIVANDVYLVPRGGSWIGYIDDQGNSARLMTDSHSATLCSTTLIPPNPALYDGKNVNVMKDTVCAIAATYYHISTYAVSTNITWDPIAGPGVKEGQTNMNYFFLGDPGKASTNAYALDKPTRVIVTGLSCTLSAAPTIDLGPVMKSEQVQHIVAYVDSSKVQLKAHCAGTNITNPAVNVPISYVLAPAGTSRARMGGRTRRPSATVVLHEFDKIRHTFLQHR